MNPTARSSNWLHAGYQRWLKPAFFRIDPETIHHTVLRSLAFAGQSPVLCDLLRELFPIPTLPVRAMGLDFPNPIGLAAGMDKNGVAIPAWGAMGFGFAEVGGVTQYPQPGNDRPRLFRAPTTEAIVNRMGFNNLGADALQHQLKRPSNASRVPIGINLGKSKRTPLEHAHEDFAYSFQSLRDYADFFVVNVSSPNTPGLRQLQDRDALRTILTTLNDINAKGESNDGTPTKPILVKISPDLTLSAVDDVIALALDLKLAGIVATNTTTQRPDPANGSVPDSYSETGGLSGRPLQEMSTQIVKHIWKATQGQLTILGVGGIHDAASAWEKLAAGATLCQLYSSLIYEGPGLLGQIGEGLVGQLRQHGLRRVDELVGSGLPYVPPTPSGPRPNPS